MEVKTITKSTYDVVVVGGGIGGVSAAVAAAREGAKVLLIEKSINLGGLATRGLISWYEPLCDGNGKKMVGGIGEELIRLSASVGLEDMPAAWGGRLSERERPYKRYATHFSPTFFSLALDRWVMDAGVKLLFDSYATYPVMEADGKRLRGVLVEEAAGRVFYPAKMVIDATGDAALFHRAGAPCVLGNNFLSYWAHDFSYETAKAYAADGNLAKFRHWNHAGSSANGNGHPEGMRLFTGESAEEITEFICEGKALLSKKYEGTEVDKREIMALPEMPQFRTIRHIVGKSTFLGTEDGVDSQEAVGYITDFRRGGTHYAIPYSTLYHPDYPNLLAAGRIVSAEGDGWEITRVIPGCALTGEAAGKAAVLALQHGCCADAVPYDALRAMLTNSGVLFSLFGN